MDHVMYAIKHLPSGGFLPNPAGRGGRGGTHVEPVPANGPWPPRLFHTEHAAKVALTYWLQGRVTVSHNMDFFGDSDETWHVEKDENRCREDMAVVRIRLIEEPVRLGD